MQPQEAVMGMFAIFAIFIALPWIVLTFISRRRESDARTVADPAMNATLLGIAERLERRLDAIETLLDHEMPGWRRSMDRRSA